jgi:hypothetical protein
MAKGPSSIYSTNGASPENDAQPVEELIEAVVSRKKE